MNTLVVTAQRYPGSKTPDPRRLHRWRVGAEAAEPVPGLIAAKLAIPYQGRVLPRPRLRSLAGSLRRGGVVSVVAGPGYGKTAFLVDVLSAGEVSGMYYALDEQDQDPVQFLSYLIRGLETMHPGLGESAWQRLAESSDPRGDVLHVVGALLSGMASWSHEPTIIALDDVHTVDGSEPVVAALSFLLDGLPPGWTAILASRRLLPLPAEQLRSRGALVDIDMRRLRLTPTEVQEWALGLWGLELSLEEARSLWRVTEGWPVGLVLIGERLVRSKRARISEDLRGLSHQGRHLNEYLADSVFNALDPDTATVLRVSSLLPRVVFPRDAVVLPGDPGAAERTLEGLVARGFLVSQSGHRTFTVHRLVRAFAEKDLRQSDPETFVAVALSVARHLEKVGEFRESLALYLRAGRVEEAVGPLRALATAHLDASTTYVAGEWMDLLPGEVVEREPYLLLLRARVLQDRGESHEAESVYRQATRLFAADGDRSGQLRAMLGQAFCLYLTGRWDDTVAVLQKAEKVTSDRDERAEVLLNMGNVLLSQCRWDQAVEKYEHALVLASAATRRSMETRVSGHRTRLFHLRGRYVTALEWVRRAVSLASSEGRVKYATMLNGAATLLYLTGEYDGAAMQAEASLALVRARGYAFLEAPVLLSLAGVSLGRGDVRSALALIRKAQALSRASSDTEAEVWAEDMLGDISRRNRNPVRALEHHRRALEIAEERQLSVYEQVRALCGVAMDLAVGVDGRQAEATLDEVIEQARRWGFDALLAQALFYKGWFHARCGRESAAGRVLAEAMQMAAAQRYVHFFAQEATVAVPVMALCRRLGCGDFLEEYVVPRLSGRLRDYYRALAAGAIYPVDVDLGPPRLSRWDAQAYAIDSSEKAEVLEIVRRVSSLTAREREVLQMVASGLPNKVIASRLVITEKTVKTHTYNLYRKLDVTNRLQAVLAYQEFERSDKGPPRMPQSGG